MPLSPSSAVDRAREQTTNIFGTCLATVWAWYGYPATLGAQPGRSFATALDSYYYTTDRHPGDYDPPIGVPVWFGVSPTRTDANAAAGDVCLSIGGGRIRCTDAGPNGVVGEMTIAQRAAEISRPYLGWTGDFGGNSIAYSAVGQLTLHSTTSTSPEGEEEDDMPANSGFYYTASNKSIVYLIVNTGSGFEHEYSAGKPGVTEPGSYNNPVANAFGTPSYAHITEGHAKVIKAACALVRANKS